MGEKIKETKTELMIQINNYKKALKDKDEQLMDAGIIKRETLMNQIDLIEQDATDKITQIIKDCEKKTGRAFQTKITAIN